MKPMDLFLISGFLGSGKTTFLRNVLTKIPDTRCGVIVNEFGSIGIDGAVIRNTALPEGENIKMVEINNGSIFCACLKGGLLKTLAAFLEQDVDYLFVEASGLADPSSIDEILFGVENILKRRPHVERRFNYRGCICIVDSMNFPDYLDLFPAMEAQVLKSSFVLLNKWDDISEEEQAELREMVYEINPDAYLYPTNYGEVPQEVLNEKLRIENYQADSLNTPWTRPASYIINMPLLEDEAPVKAFLDELAPLTLRMKGFFRMKLGEGWVDCVGNDVQITRYATGYIENLQEKLVIIGRDATPIDDKIRAAWNRCVGTDLDMVED